MGEIPFHLVRLNNFDCFHSSPAALAGNDTPTYETMTAEDRRQVSCSPPLTSFERVLELAYQQDLGQLAQPLLFCVYLQLVNMMLYRAKQRGFLELDLLMVCCSLFLGMGAIFCVPPPPPPPRLSSFYPWCRMPPEIRSRVFVYSQGTLHRISRMSVSVTDVALFLGAR